MYKQRDTSVPRKHPADYRDRGNCGTTKTRNIHIQWSIALNWSISVELKRKDWTLFKRLLSITADIDQH